MKKYLTLFFALSGLVTIVNGQTFKTFSDDFESYSNSAWLAQTSSVWTTWSGTPATTGDDVQVTTSDAYSGTKSLYFNTGPGPEDVVLPFGGVHEKGQFVYSAMMKIPVGKSAYFNFQADATVGQTWAVEVTFKIDSSLVFSNLTSGTMFQDRYPQGQWFEMKMYVNLTKNEWHLFIDQEYRGSFSNSVNRVSFLDIYPIDNNSSYWVDDVSFTYAPPSPNNAGIEIMTSPVSPVCGTNDVKVRVVNNGNNALDSVRIYWTLDGKMQKPVFVKKTIDTIYSKTGNRLEVTLDSTLHLNKGMHKIKAWTAYPNGVADTLNFDDTLRTSFEAEIRGIGLVYAKPFQGNKGLGTAAWPDTVCVYDTLTYGVTPPTGYTNADLGTGWFIKSVDIESNGLAAVDTQTIRPVGKSNFRLRYVADSTEGDSLFKIEISVSVGKGGCDTVLSQYFYVSRQPHVAFTAGDTCLGEVVIFNNSSNGGANNKYSWKFGDNTGSSYMNTAKFYTNPGTYDVTLRAVAPSGCYSSVSKKVTVFDIPESKFSLVDACDSSSAQFYDSSIVKNGNITGYHWEFGDGDTSNRQNATHIYDAVGTYTIRLTVTSDNGCSHKSGQKVIVNPVPDAAFSAEGRCEIDSIEFIDATSYTGTDALSYEWDFGDGKQSFAEHPYHLYSAPGKYSVKMKVMTTQGCMDSTQVSVEVYPMPMADFSMANTCLGDMTAFTNNSSISSGTYGSVWDFGDGMTDNTASPSHSFSMANNFDVMLVATSNHGCVDSISKQLTIHELPVPMFSANDACAYDSLMFSNTSTTNSSGMTYMWHLGDGMSSTAKDPVHRYDSAGVYSAQLIVTDAEGCIDSSTVEVEALPVPEALFTLNNACQDEEVVFDNQSTTSSGTLTNQWSFGNGKTSVALSPKSVYIKDGNFNVKLIVKTKDGCMDTMEKSIEIYPLPDAEFTYSHQGYGRYVFSPNDKGLASYHWDFGDGDTSTVVSPYHAFADEDAFNVTLKTVGNNSCSSEETHRVSVSTGIAEADPIASPFKVYPNPFKDEVNIVYQLQNTSQVNIEVYSINGKRLVDIVNQKQSTGEYQYQFNTPEASGIYMIRMVIDGNVYHERIVKAE